MKYTLLQMTQSILSSMSSDEVNSISDTAESMQVAECIRQTYLNMLGRYDLPEHNQLIQLNPSDQSNQPVLMFRPDGVQRIEWLEYFDSNPADGAQVQTSQFGSFSHGLNTDLQQQSNWVTTSNTTNTVGLGTLTFTVDPNLPVIHGQSVTVSSGLATMFGSVTSYAGTTLVVNIQQTVGSGTYSFWNIVSGSTNTPPGYRRVKLLPLEEFLDMVNSFNTAETTVGTMSVVMSELSTGSPMTFQINYKNNKQPQFWTIVNDFFILFDSYDNTQENTLQASKTMALAWLMPAFTLEDTFIPNLDEQLFPLLLADAKELAFYELKQMPHPMANKEVMRQQISLQKFKFIAHRPTPFQELPNFGRTGRQWSI